MAVEIATCNYHGFTDDMGIPVRTSVGSPKWPNFDVLPHWRNVTPLPYSLSKPFKAYHEIYLAMLEGHGIQTLEEDAEAILEWWVDNVGKPSKPRLVFMCFENLSQPGKWCHRSMFAGWWEQQTGRAVTELGPHRHTADVTPPEPEPEQLTLL